MGHIRASSSKVSDDKPSKRGGTSRKREAQLETSLTRDSSNSDLPGVQKLKAALRQTRRLLAKDNLAADVRVQTERRLRSLEADLKVAERRKKERAMALKYHKVKFFERKKVLRKIKQVEKHISESSSKVSSTKFVNALFELRVDLNYVLHYPKLEKYISLFPPTGHPESGPHDDSARQSNPETDARREELRTLIKRKMEWGELSIEPDLVPEAGQGSKHGAKTQSLTLGILGSGPGKSDGDNHRGSKNQENKGSSVKADAAEDDGFFDADY